MLERLLLKSDTLLWKRLEFVAVISKVYCGKHLNFTELFMILQLEEEEEGIKREIEGGNNDNANTNNNNDNYDDNNNNTNNNN